MNKSFFGRVLIWKNIRKSFRKYDSIYLFIFLNAEDFVFPFDFSIWFHLFRSSFFIQTWFRYTYVCAVWLVFGIICLNRTNDIEQRILLFYYNYFFICHTLLNFGVFERDNIFLIKTAVYITLLQCQILNI